jgi:beta-lactamase class A
MTLFTKNFIISLLLILAFFLNQPLSSATDQEDPPVKTKKSVKKNPQKKKTKHPSNQRKKTNSKSSPSKKKKKPASTSGQAAQVVKLGPTLEPPVRTQSPVTGGSLQELVENEVFQLKSIKHLLPEDQISLQVYDLNEKRMLADINGSVIRNAASLIKPFVMLAVFEAIARQDLQETPEIEHQLNRMIAISDNGATNTLIRRLGKGDSLQGIIGINALMAKLGFLDTHLRELIPHGGKTYANQTSANDNTHFFRLLYEQKLITPQYSQKMNDILLKSIHDRIRTYQIKQDGVAVADKTGYVRGLNGDCGIIYQKSQNGCNDYVLSIIIENKNRPSDGAWGRQKSAAIRYLSDRIYQKLRNGHGRG